MDIQKYLRRIKHAGGLVPSLHTLKQLQREHLLNIPFENLDIHNQIPVELNIDHIFDKIVLKNRGGICYELNGLFFGLLHALGFPVKMISARAYNKEHGYGPEFDHLAIIATINNREYLCDVGFGEFAFGPLAITPGVVQKDERGEFVIHQFNENNYQVNRMEDGLPQPQYIFQTAKRMLNEFQNMCNYHQTSTDSNFTQKKLISLPTQNGRITISGHTLKITESGLVKEVNIENEADFKKKLAHLFHIKI